MPETVEIENFDVQFTYSCPKCSFQNNEISMSDLTNGSIECGMCETIFKIEGIDGIKITATFD